MPKMKHLLRKLHIGGGINEHQRLEEVGRPEISSPSPADLSPVAESTPFASSGSGSDGLGRTDAAESAGDDVDFGLLEEEFQMQLAMAISASEPETAQIDSAKRISLAGGNNNVLAEFLSLRYWSHNVINYDEKIMDGFYDVCGITSSSVSQGKMPSLVDLQAISVSDNVHYEVVLVNRLLDHKLQELEKQVYDEYLEHYAMVHGSNLGGFIQKIACLVVDRLGGPVGDAEVMTRMWTLRSVELRNSLDTIILPLGHLDVGISRHRALLFKVLADRIGLPCLLVKGSYYTGTDDGAVNLIKIDGESEYIIDLMGAPGALIPVEVPSSHLPNSGSLLRCFADDTETPKDASLLHSKGAVNKSIPPLIDLFPKAETLGLGEAIIGGNGANEDGTGLSGNSSSGASEHELGKIVSVPESGEGSSSNHVKPSSLQKRKVKNVSKYVISASKDPGFAQKLHAVLLESGASPPPDLFLNINSHDMGESNTMHQTVQEKGSSVDKDFLFRAKNFFSNQGPSFVSSGCEPVNSFNHNIAGKPASLQQKELDVVPTEFKVSSPFDITGENALVTEDRRIQRISGNKSSVKESAAELRAASKSVMHISGGRMSREVAECEIDWEDLQIGERIGIGSYGEVYHGEWNGTEVAVKKFLDQDLTGDALVQLKCEIEIMLRLRHPNVVLFMGAVFRSPHLSILTEFLPRGSLYKILHRPVPPLDEKRRMRMALDVAKGMNYLHTSHPPIVHRDLKSPNLLVDRNWVVKVCDFGLSRLKHHTFLSSKSTAGTPEWMAPEVLRNEPANEKCDVYSFGVILWELITLRIPWKGLNPMQVVGAVGFQNRRLEIPDDVDPAVAQIIRECFITEPHLRPSFAQLTARLRHLQRQYIERSHSGNQNTE